MLHLGITQSTGTTQDFIKWMSTLESSSTTETLQGITEEKQAISPSELR